MWCSGWKKMGAHMSSEAHVLGHDSSSGLPLCLLGVLRLFT